MKHKIVIQAILLTFSCALVLAAVSWFSEKSGHPPHAAAVFAGQKPPELTDGNLVDGLGSLELSVPIAKADLNRGILSVDLKVSGDDVSEARLYQGMAEMIDFAFGKTSNVDQLLLRLVAEDRWLSTKYLLLAADVRRSEFTSEDLAELRRTSDGEMPEALRQRMRVTETRLWKTRFLGE
ncbi:hypothetical protein [Paenibacillus macerans]|uniref:hypothetical protein n=1 Tax=Paenibacillus macerans TaxID=44252 RepID=UPI003D31F274